MLKTKHHGFPGNRIPAAASPRRGRRAPARTFAPVLTAALLASSQTGAGERHHGSPAAGSIIPVLLHVVACAPDLLHCRDLDLPDAVFEDMAACHERLAELRADAPGAGALFGAVTFVRCRYVLPATRHAGSRTAGTAPATPADEAPADHRSAASATRCGPLWLETEHRRAAGPGCPELARSSTEKEMAR